MLSYIARLFKIVGNDAEAVKWIKQFSEVDRAKFAVIKVSGECVENNLDSLVEDFGVLSRLDLFPPIVYGWGKALDEVLKNNSIQSSWDPVTGDRITTPEVMKYVWEISQSYGNRIVEKFKQEGIEARLCQGQVIAEPIDPSNSNCRNGKVISIDQEGIESLINSAIVPIISPLGNYHGTFLNINADSVGRETVLAIKPLKYCQLTNTGGIFDSEGEVIKRISISRDYERLINNGTISGGMKKKLNEARELIETVGDDNFAVQIVSPNYLLKELFTDIGAGTYIEK